MVNYLKNRYVQWVTDIYVDRCDPTRPVYGQLANAELFRALISVAEPSWKDDIQLLTGKSWLKHARKDLKRNEPAAPKWLSGGGQFLGEVAEKLDIIMYILFMVETFGGAAIQWASDAYQVGPCEFEPDYEYWSSTEPLGFWDDQNAWTEGPIWIVNKGNTAPIHSSVMHVHAGRAGYFYAAANFSGFVGFGDLKGWNTRLVELPGKIISQHQYRKGDPFNHDGPMEFYHFGPMAVDRIYRYDWMPVIEGGFLETQCTTGAAGGATYRLDNERASLLRGKVTHWWNVRTIIDPEFQNPYYSNPGFKIPSND